MASPSSVTVMDANSTPNSQAQNGTQIQILTATQLMTPSLDLLSREERDRYLNICVPLYQAALKGDWETARGVIEIHPSVVRSSITKGHETALHIAAAARRVQFVVELVNLMNPEDLELQNKNENTALCFAAAAGTVAIAQVMVDKNRRLPMIRGSKGMTPLHMAALLGHSEMVWYLYTKTNGGDLTVKDLIGLLNTCISTGLYDVALDVLNNHPRIALERDESGETALHVLARKPSAFSGENELGIWRKFIKSIPGMKVGENKSLKQTQALQLLRCVWQYVLRQEDDEKISDLIRKPSRLLFVATELGNIVFLTELIGAYPDIIWKVDNHNRSIFHVAVLHRHETIFNLIYEIGSIKDLIAAYKDENRNNMLHLAGKLAPPGRLNIVSGAALQMQRELLWFKEVEKVVQPSYVEKKNAEGKTPRVLFTEEHRALVKEGEEWMKNTASHSMVVATLIATVMFSAAFTVPGGNNQETGTPIFLQDKAFMVFAIFDAIALFTSATSILMFLSILTSRYAEDDFLESLPSRLVIGLTTLFISITTMMVAFSATYFIVYRHGFSWVPFPIALLACVPVTLFASLQYPLLTDIIHSTYGSRFLFRPNKPILY